jgi:hypothetical protein
MTSVPILSWSNIRIDYAIFIILVVFNDYMTLQIIAIFLKLLCVPLNLF